MNNIIVSLATTIIKMGGAIVPFELRGQVREAVRDLDPRHRTPCGGAFVFENGQHGQIMYVER